MTQLLRVSAGDHQRRDCPVWCDLPSTGATLPGWLVDVADGDRIPIQRVGERFVFVVDTLGRGDERTFRLEAGEPATDRVTVEDTGGALKVAVSGAPFTSYNYGADQIRPFFFPLLGPTGVAMTRNYPMIGGVAGESADHPHHRSLYVAFGDVNGVDVWSEPPHPNTGRIVH